MRSFKTIVVLSGFGFLVVSPAVFAADECPEGTTHRGEMCIYDRGPGVVALSCPHGQVQRGVECFLPPPAGWDWTTPGGVLIGEICPEGSHDTGVECAYDRGVGSVPGDGTCPDGYRVDPVTCFRDAHVFGKTRSAGWNGECDDSVENMHCLGLCGHSVVHCTLRQCPDGYGDDGATCRRNPDVLARAPACPDDRELKNGLCYERPRPGFYCDTTICSFSKNVKPGEKVGLAQSDCPDEREFTVGMCYVRPRPGFKCDITTCWAYLSQL